MYGENSLFNSKHYVRGMYDKNQTKPNQNKQTDFEKDYKRFALAKCDKILQVA